jgi:hypothetical protein
MLRGRFLSFSNREYALEADKVLWNVKIELAKVRSFRRDSEVLVAMGSRDKEVTVWWFALENQDEDAARIVYWNIILGGPASIGRAHWKNLTTYNSPRFSEWGVENV